MSHTSGGRAKTFEQIALMADVLRAIDCVAVLQRSGCLIDTYDKAKWHTPAGVISITGQKFINWTHSAGGGGAIDMVMHLRQCDFKSAVFWLDDNFPNRCTQPSRSSTTSCVHQAFSLPVRKDSVLPRIRNYLIVERNIPRRLIDALIRSGMLYADCRTNVVFLLLGKEKAVVGAELRGTTHRKWHGMARGSRKDSGCFYVGNHAGRTAVLCESAIDAISCFALHPTFIAISTSGANPNPAWLPRLIKKGYEIFCGFDSDEIGDSCANKMILLYPAVKRMRPKNHDWNDTLRSALSSSKFFSQDQQNQDDLSITNHYLEKKT